MIKNIGEIVMDGGSFTKRDNRMNINHLFKETFDDD